MTPAELYRSLVPFGGTMMNEGEAVALHRAASECGEDAVLLEIGSYYGMSTAMIARGMKAESVLFAVDPHQGRLDTATQETWSGTGSIDKMLFTLQEANVQDRVAILPCTSERAYGFFESLFGYEETYPKGEFLKFNRCGLVFIDGSHLEEDVYSDLMHFAPMVRRGGFLVLDDLGHNYVMRGYDRWHRELDDGWRLFGPPTAMTPIFVPVDLREWGLEDPVHNRLHEGCVGKTAFFRRIV